MWADVIHERCLCALWTESPLWSDILFAKVNWSHQNPRDTTQVADEHRLCEIQPISWCCQIFYVLLCSYVVWTSLVTHTNKQMNWFPTDSKICTMENILKVVLLVLFFTQQLCLHCKLPMSWLSWGAFRPLLKAPTSSLHFQCHLFPHCQSRK